MPAEWQRGSVYLKSLLKFHNRQWIIYTMIKNGVLEGLLEVISQINFHSVQTTQYRLPNRSLADRFKRSLFTISKAKNNADFHSSALNLRQRVLRIPEVVKQLHPLDKLLRRRIGKAGSVFNAIVTVKGIVGLAPHKLPH